MANHGFQHLNDVQLDRLSDDEILEHMRRARVADELESVKLAAQILVFRHLPNIERRVSMKVPERAVEEVTGKAFIAALFSSLRGDSRGEFHAWLNQIVKRRIADYHRVNRLEETPLGSEHEGEDDVWGFLPAAADEYGAAELMTVVDGILQEFNPVHQQVIDLYAFQRAPAKEVADEVNATHGAQLEKPMNENNVHKIAERFREKLRAELEEGDSSP